MSSSTVTSPIYYGYTGSPFVAKLETIFRLKSIPARRVDVPLFPPRVDILALGIPYRRVPILALGRDVYIDTFLITEVLDELYPSNPLLSSDRALQTMVSRFYADRTLFDVGFEILPWTKTPKALQEDRKKFIGRDVDFASMASGIERGNSKLISHLTTLEEHLSDGRQWLFATPNPGYADASFYAVLSWQRSFRATRPVFDISEFPKVVSWLDRLTAILAEKPQLGKVSGNDAKREIFSTGYTADLSEIGFNNVEAKRLGVEKGALVSIIPEDTGKEAKTVGTLLALSRTRMVIETEDQHSKGGPSSVRVHFPRVGYSVRKLSMNEETAKL